VILPANDVALLAASARLEQDSRVACYPRAPARSHTSSHQQGIQPCCHCA